MCIILCETCEKRPCHNRCEIKIKSGAPSDHSDQLLDGAINYQTNGLGTLPHLYWINKISYQIKFLKLCNQFEINLINFGKG